MKIVTCLLLLLLVADCNAVIPDSDTPNPGPLHIAEWRGAGSAVAIGPRVLLTAQHIVGLGADTGTQYLTMQGEGFFTTDYRRCPLTYPNYIGTCDLAIIRVDHDLPGYHRLRAQAVTTGTRILVAGFGFGRGEAVRNPAGTIIGFTHSARGALHWGYNVAEQSPQHSYDTGITMLFDPPTHARWTPGEATVAMTDSGSPFFVQSTDGKWEVSGIVNGGGGSPPFATPPYPQGSYYNMTSIGGLRTATPAVIQWLNTELLRGPLCDADFVSPGVISLEDLYAFLGAYLTGSSSADVNHNGVISIEDVFIFLGKWFSNCNY